MTPNDPYEQGGLRKVRVPAGEYTEPVGAHTTATNTGGPVRKPTPEILSQMQELEEALTREAVEEQKEAWDGKSPEKSPEQEKDGRIEIDDIPEEALPSFQTVFYRNTPTDNPKARADIEKRCSELSFTELITTGRVSQRIEILGDRLVVKFMSLKAADNLWIERQALKALSDIEGRIWAGYARLVASLVSINDIVFEDHVDSTVSGGINEEKFSEKYKQVMDQSERIIEILLVNLTWFDDRVGGLFVNESEALKNG